MIVRFVGLAMFAVVVLIFGFANLHLVELNTVFTEEVKASLTFLLLAAFVSGFLTATLLGMQRVLKEKRSQRLQLQHVTESAQLAETTSVLLPAPPQIPMRIERESKRRFWRLWR